MRRKLTVLDVIVAAAIVAVMAVVVSGVSGCAGYNATQMAELNGVLQQTQASVVQLRRDVAAIEDRTFAAADPKTETGQKIRSAETQIAVVREQQTTRPADPGLAEQLATLRAVVLELAKKPDSGIPQGVINALQKAQSYLKRGEDNLEKVAGVLDAAKDANDSGEAAVKVAQKAAETWGGQYGALISAGIGVIGIIVAGIQRQQKLKAMAAADSITDAVSAGIANGSIRVESNAANAADAIVKEHPVTDRFIDKLSKP